MCVVLCSIAYNFCFVVILSGEKHDLYVQSSAASFTEIIGLFLSMCNLSLTSLAPHSLLVL